MDLVRHFFVFGYIGQVYYPYLITGRRASGECQHSSTTVLERSSQEASHIGGNATLLRGLLLELGREQLQ